MKDVTIYTDGSCKGNPGPGGYGTVLLYKDHKKELSQGFRLTTNNRMELMGVIVGLRALKMKCRVTVFSDSKYVVDAINNRWLINWKKAHWKRNGSKPVMNLDLWEELSELIDYHEVKFEWVKGHAQNAGNIRCDFLAVAAAEGPNFAIDYNFEKEEKKV